MTYNMENDILKVLVTEEQISEIVKKISAQITEDYRESEHLVLLCILKGSAPFFADIVRHLNVPCEFEFMRVSSYGSGTESSGELNIILDMNRSDISECDVVIVEDIIDSGNTLSHIKELFTSRKVKSLRICTLLDKPSRRKVPLEPDYCGFTIPDEFIVGYGLDYDEKYRLEHDICVLSRSVYEK